MAKIIVVTSGKGGVGKTTTSASFGSGLAMRGYKTVVIDFDVGLRNLDLIMGCERRVVYDMINVIQGEANLSQALIRDPDLENLFILPASQTRDKDALTDEGISRIIEELSSQFDYIVCDSPAGIERGAILAMYHADEALIVTNPEVSSVRDSDRIIGMLDSKTKKAEQNLGRVRKWLVITRFDPVRAQKEEMLDIDTISKDLLRVEPIGIIPESPAVLTASNSGIPVIRDASSQAGQAYEDMVARFLGEARPYRFLDVPQAPAPVQQKGWLARLFGV